MAQKHTTCRRDATTRKRNILITSTWTLAVVFVLAAGLYLGLGEYNPKSTNARPTDMREITNGLDTLYCAGAEVYSLYWDADVYLLTDKPRVNPGLRQIHTAHESQRIQGRYYHYYTYYMLEGSSVSVNSTCDTHLDFYVFQGHANFEKLINNEECDRCYIYYQSFRGFINYELKNTSTDDYYFVYVNKNMFESETLLSNFVINRTLYDVGSSIPCVYSWPDKCRFDLI
jgi:hypothetical protein